MLSIGRNSNGETMLVLEECVQFGNRLSYERFFEQVLAEESRSVLIDLHRLPNITPLTLERIIDFEWRLATLGKTLQLTGCSEHVLSVLRELKVTEYLSVV